jgi:hypothetical protein
MKARITALLFVLGFVLVAASKVSASDFTEFTLWSGQTVSEVVAEQIGGAHAWQSNLVVILHPSWDMEYSKDEATMASLPEGARIWIADELYESDIKVDSKVSPVVVVIERHDLLPQVQSDPIHSVIATPPPPSIMVGPAMKSEPRYSFITSSSYIINVFFLLAAIILIVRRLPRPKPLYIVPNKSSPKFVPDEAEARAS